jgi:hypothetical protein
VGLVGGEGGGKGGEPVVVCVKIVCTFRFVVVVDL